MNKHLQYLLCAALLLAFSGLCWACTDVRIETKDGAFLIGRSMEFAIDLNSEIFLSPRGVKKTGTAPSGSGIEWLSKYAYLGVNGFGVKDGVIDGINEKGLSVGFLWFPGTQYEKAEEIDPEKVIDITSLGSWILGNFQTVEEVRTAFEEVTVWGEVVPQLGIMPPLHIAIHDAEGNSIVVEFVDGEKKIYNNNVGVLTNAPEYDWHITNLRNYIGITATNAAPVELDKISLKQIGQGSGYLGIPGDWTPPSRFIRSVFFTANADQAGSSEEGVILLQHIMNTVDIPKGDIKENKGESVPGEEHTQWVIIKDLKNKKLYYRSYDDLSIKTVDMNELDLTGKTKTVSIPIDKK